MSQRARSLRLKLTLWYLLVFSTAQENVMPAFGDNPNVACYMDDLYVYLRARSTEAWGRQRPAKKEEKTEAYKKAEDACMGNK